jgi:hypothetical protein
MQMHAVLLRELLHWLLADWGKYYHHEVRYHMEEPSEIIAQVSSFHACIITVLLYALDLQVILSTRQ